MKKNNWSVVNLSRIALVCAIYVCLTLAFAPISYGNIQFRISEILVLLCFYNPIYVIALTLGCLISNMFTPGVVIFDLIFGTLHTFISALFISKSKKHLSIASLYPAIFSFVCAIGISLSYGLPYILTTFQVTFSEAIVVIGLGYPIFKSIEKNNAFLKSIDNKKNIVKDNKNPIDYFVSLISVILIIMFFIIKFYDSNTLFEGVDISFIPYVILLIQVGIVLLSLFKNNKPILLLKIIISFILLGLLVAFSIIAGSILLSGIVYILMVVMIIVLLILKYAQINIENK